MTNLWLQDFSIRRFLCVLIYDLKRKWRSKQTKTPDTKEKVICRKGGFTKLTESHLQEILQPETYRKYDFFITPGGFLQTNTPIM